MSRSNDHHGANIPLVLLLVIFVTVVTEKSVAFGSSAASDRIARRPDPLQRFKHYGGVYDIRNKHYWATTAFTGVHGYGMAGVWLLSGIGSGIFVVVRNLCGSKSPAVNHQNSVYLIVFLLIILFTMFAMIASSVIIVANQKSQERSNMLEETIFRGGDDASQTMGKVETALTHMQSLICTYDSKTCDLLDSVARQLEKDSSDIRRFVDSTRKSCDQAIQILYVVNLVVASVNLVLLVVGLFLLILHYRPGILVLIFSCWILTTLSWVLTGLDFFLYTFIGDTCSTLRHFEENPEDNALSDMLPCPKSTGSDQTLVQINSQIHSFISQINSRLLEMRQVLDTSEANEDQSIPEICDPFANAPNLSFSPENCGKDSIPVGDLPSVLSRFICYENGSCDEKDGKFVPEAFYVVSIALSEAIQELINIYPDIMSLIQCSSVKQAFSDVVARQCRPIELSIRVLWSSTLALSLVMMVLVLLWSEKAILDKGRSYSRCSIFPKPIRMD